MFYLKHSFGNTWESPSSIGTPTERARIAPGGDSAARAAGRVHKGTFRGSAVRAGPASRALASLYPEPFTGHNRATEADFSENVPRAERCVDVLSSRERRGVLNGGPAETQDPPSTACGAPSGPHTPQPPWGLTQGSWAGKSAPSSSKQSILCGKMCRAG